VTRGNEDARARVLALFEQLPVAIAILRGPELRFELTNALGRELTGGLAQPGVRAAEIFGDQPQVLDLLGAVIRDGSPIQAHEFPVRLSDGRGGVRDAFVTGKYEALRDDDGAVDGVLAYAYDVTDTVLARKRAQASEARFRRLHDSGVIGIVFWTREGQVIDANDAFLRMVGYTREELSRGALHWREMTPPEFAPLDERALLEMDERGICTPYEKEYLHKDGTRVPIELGIAFWEGSRTEGVAWILDIRRRKDAEAQLRAVTDSLPALVAFIDRDLRYRFVNRAYLEWLGVTSPKVLGRTMEEVLGAAAFARIRPHVARALGGESVQFEEQRPYCGGPPRDVRAAYVPHGDGFVALVIDTSRERAAERERIELLFREQQARAEAEAAVRKRDEFLSIASHELRTPLTSLSLTLQSLGRALERGEVDVERAEQTVRRLRGQIGRLTALVDDLLDVSRLTEGRLPLSKATVDLVPLIDDVISRFAHEASAAASTISRTGDGAAIGEWDRSRIDQVITNLLANAIKYGRGAPIAVAVRAEPERAVIEVRDGGIGIAEEDQRRIFERFERAASPRQFSGLGLGLWITRSIVEAHGGTIAVESAPGQGACFVVQLPPTPST